MPLSPGRMLSHYRLIEKIGEGGMGVEWSADDTVLGRQVAIKVLPDDFAQDAERLARFKQEARLLAALNHTNIAAIYGLEESSPRLTDAILHQTPVTPRAVNPRVSPEMERIVLKCLQKGPENRYQSAKEIGVDLRLLATSSGDSNRFTVPSNQKAVAYGEHGDGHRNGSPRCLAGRLQCRRGA